MTTLTFENGYLSFYDDNGTGWKNILFEFNGKLSSDYSSKTEEVDKNTIKVTFTTEGHQQIITCVKKPDLKTLTVSREIKNNSSAPLPFKFVSDGLLDEKGEVSLGIEITPIDLFKIRYIHTSNVRREKFPEFRPEYPYIRPIPYDPVHFNHCEANHFPAFIVCDNKYHNLLIEGDLKQLNFERSWELGLNGKNKESYPGHYKSIQDYKMTSQYVLEPSESMEVSKVFYQIANHTHPQDAYEGYVDTLNELYDFRGKDTLALHAGIYCTWNYGVLHRINEENILKRAKILSEKIPECTHFLIDDGYQAKRNDRNAGFCSFYPVPAEGYEKTLFPKGMKYISDSIREMNLKPCIWLSPKIYLDSDLAKEKPEWLLRDTEGSEKLIGESTFLDLSNEDARKFYLQILDALFIEWGYEGIKFDFMTQWFLLENAHYSYGSGTEWRDFAFSEIRKRIGDEGFFMTCIAMSTGNPFPGLNADCYRCGFDIHDGTWAEQIRACQATLPQVLLEGRKTFLLNMDSAGFSDIPENELLFRFTWNFITQGILEIGGILENHTEEQFEMLNKLLKNVDRGHKVTCLDDRALTGEPLPEALQVKYPEDSVTYKNGTKQHIAFFNWSEEVKAISVPMKRADITVPVMFENYWTGEQVEISGEMIIEVLEPHSAVLYSVK